MARLGDALRGIVFKDGNRTRIAPPSEPTSRKLPNWLQAYAQYTAINEAPQEFHVWVALGTIMGATGRKISIPMAHFNIFTNMYIVLVGPPATRKTTALNIGQKLLREVSGVNLGPDATTAAAIVQEMSQLPKEGDQAITVYSGELGTLLSEGDPVLIDMLTDLFDCKDNWRKKTVGRGNETIARPWLNFMAATTQAWLGDNLPETAVRGGFVSRVLFVFSDKIELRSPMPRETQQMRDLRDLLINDLKHIASLNGEFVLSPEAADLYENWYMDRSRFPAITDARSEGYYARKHIHVLKVAMALSLAEKDELVLEARDIRAALAFLGEIETGMARTFSAVGRNELAVLIERVKVLVAQSGGTIPYKRLAQRTYQDLPKEELDKVIDQLVAMGEVRVASAAGGGGKVISLIAQPNT